MAGGLSIVAEGFGSDTDAITQKMQNAFYNTCRNSPDFRKYVELMRTAGYNVYYTLKNGNQDGIAPILANADQHTHSKVVGKNIYINLYASDFDGDTLKFSDGLEVNTSTTSHFLQYSDLHLSSDPGFFNTFERSMAHETYNGFLMSRGMTATQINTAGASENIHGEDYLGTVAAEDQISKQLSNAYNQAVYNRYGMDNHLIFNNPGSGYSYSINNIKFMNSGTASNPDGYCNPGPVPPKEDYVHGIVVPFDLAQELHCPLVLDLGQLGISFLGPQTEDSHVISFSSGGTVTSSGEYQYPTVEGLGVVYWDYDNDGFREASTWVGPEEGMLCVDRNGNGMIDNQSELFGGVSGGFADLSFYDTNHDDVINSDDNDFSKLLVWIDSDSDAYSSPDELHSLTDLGIVSINLNATPVDYRINGNLITHEATFVTEDLATHKIVEAWLYQDNVNSLYDSRIGDNLAAFLLPDVRGYGNLPNLNIAMTMNDTLYDMVSELAGKSIEDLFDVSFDIEDVIKDIMFEWAGVSALSSDCRGGLLTDDRKLEFLEEFVGSAYVQAGYFTNPNPLAVHLIEEAFLAAQNNIAARLLSQTEAGNLLEGIAYRPFAGGFEGFDGIDSDVLISLENIADNSTDPLSFWKPIVQMVEFSVGLENLSSTDFEALDTAIQNTTLGFDLDGILASLFRASAIQMLGTSGSDTLTGGAEENKIVGYEGDDILYGLGGVDQLDGGDGDDTLAGGIGDDALFGGNGNDTYLYESGQDNIDELADTPGNIDKIVFASGITISDLSFARDHDNLNITVDGLGGITIYDQFAHGTSVERLVFSDGSIIDLTAFERPIVGTSGGDTLSGNDASIFPQDILQGLAGNDTLIGGAGDDILEGGDGDDDDVYVITEGSDIVTDTGGNDTIVFGAEYDPEEIEYVLTKDGGLDIFFGTSLAAHINNQFIGNGTYAIETLKFDDDSTVSLSTVQFEQHGDNKANQIYGLRVGASEDNLLFGEGGNDVLYGYEGDDTLDGGEGNDIMDGGTGDDTYIVSAGYNTVMDNGGNDLLVFGEAYAEEDMSFQRVGGSNLQISFNDVPTVLISYFFNSIGGIETIQFSDESTLDLTGYHNVLGTASSESLSGLDNELLLDDIIYGYAGADTIEGGDGNDTLDGGADADILFGQSGDDVIIGGGGDDTLDGGDGDNYLQGDAGDDTYVHSSGYTIVYDTGGSADKIVFSPGFDYVDMTLVRNGLYDLNVLFDDEVVLTIVNQFTTNGSVETLLFDDETTVDLLSIAYTMEGGSGNDVLYGVDAGGANDAIYGNDGDDAIYGFGGNDTLDGGDGDDYLAGGLGDDTYLINDGYDIVADVGGDDTIVFSSAYDPLDISFVRNGSSLDVLFDTVVAVTIEGQFSTGGAIETLQFDDMSTIDLSTIQYTLTGTSGEDFLVGIDSGGNPNDVIYGLGDDDILVGLGGDDTLEGGDGDDLVSGGLGDDVYIYTSGVDTYIDQGGNDVIKFGVGYDALDMTVVKVNTYDLNILFNDVLVVTIKDHFRGDGGIETIEFYDTSTFDLTTLETVTNGTSGNDNFVGTDSATVIDVMHGLDGNDVIYGRQGNDRLFGDDGNDYIYAEDGNDNLDGGAGSDTLEGGAGDDTYIFSPGADVINEATGSGGDDKILFGDGVYFSDLVLHREITSEGDNNHLIISDSSSNSVTILYQNYTGGPRTIETLAFADGSEVDLTEQRVTTFGTTGGNTIYGIETGASPDDIIYAGAGNDTILAYSGNDTINGGTGTDSMAGGTGNDTYLFEPGFGNATTSGDDYIYEVVSEGTDTIELGGGILPQDVLLWTDYYGSMYLRLTSSSDDEIRIYGENSGSGTDVVNRLEQIVFQNIGTVNLTQGLQLADTGDGHTISGSALDDIIDGRAGNDQIFGYAGNDMIIGGSGYDILRGGTGDDTYILDPGFGLAYSYQADSIIENTGEGSDTILIGGSLTLNDIYLWTDYTGALHLKFSASAEDEVVIYGETSSSMSDVNNRIEQIKFSTGGVLSLANGLILRDTDSGHTMIGTDDNDVLSGNGGNDNLYGYSGSDTLTGGSGQDALYGGTGNDTYVFAPGFGLTSQPDSLQENTSEGTDTIWMSGALMPSDLRIWVDYYGSMHIQLASNADDRVDVYGVNSGTGTDIGSRIEKILFDNGVVWDLTAGIKATDTDTGHDNFGSAQADTLDGQGGNDSLVGYAGNDTLIGGTGDDYMAGGTGDDTYYVDSTSDYAVENASSGTDTVYSSVNWTLGTYFEHLFLTGSSNINGTGNAEDNTITGNTGDNSLSGDDGADYLLGGAGSDVLSGGNSNDVLDGGAGSDVLTGGSGADTFVINDLSSIDTIADFNTGQSDVLDIRDLLAAYDDGTDILTDWVRISDNGGNSKVEVDIDGAGGTYSWVEVASLTGVTGLTDEAALVTNGNLLVT